MRERERERERESEFESVCERERERERERDTHTEEKPEEWIRRFHGIDDGSFDKLKTKLYKKSKGLG